MGKDDYDDHGEQRTRMCPSCGKDHAPDQDEPITANEQASHHVDKVESP